MSDLRRRMMVQQGGGSILPPEYQEVEYIETVANCVNTFPIVSYKIIGQPLNSIDFKGEIEQLSSVGSRAIIGLFTNGSYCKVMSFLDNGVNLAIENQTNGANRVYFGVQSAVGLRFKIKLKGNQATLTVNGNDIVRTINNSSTEAIVRDNERTTVFMIWGSVLRFWGRATFWANGEVVSIAVPCYEKSNPSHILFYDIINNEEINNAREKAVVVGPDVN